MLKYAILGLALFSSLASFAVNVEDVNTVMTEKNCSGDWQDMKCYSKVIKDTALGIERPSADFSKKVYQGTHVEIDTQDVESCREVQNSLLDLGAQRAQADSLNLQDLCNPNSQDPEDRYKKITLMWETSEDSLTTLNLKRLTNADQSLVNHTKNLTLMMVGTMGLLWVLPESISMWNKDDIKKEGLSKWKNHVGSSPQIDHDSPFINYVMHPISGAAYYTVARSSGHSIMESFGYSVMMSTFFWEYGFEALAEPPSIQDLIVTPVVGALIGELYYNWALKIKSNGGQVLGSKKLGSVMLFVLSPAEAVSKGINQVLGKKTIQGAQSNLVLARKKRIDPLGPQYHNYIGVKFDFAF